MDAKAQPQLAMTFDSERGVLTITEFDGRSFFFPNAVVIRRTWMECGGSHQCTPRLQNPTISTRKLEIEVAKDAPEIVFDRFIQKMVELCSFN